MQSFIRRNKYFPLLPPISTTHLLYSTMEYKYQYSSLFTSGLLMMPRSGPTLPFVDIVAPQPMEMENELLGPRTMSSNTTMPIIVNIPAIAPTQRRTAQRRPSSLLLRLSPRSSPVEDARDRIKRLGGASSLVSDTPVPTQTFSRLPSSSSTKEQVETSEAQGSNYATYPKAAAYPRGQDTPRGHTG